MKLNQEKTGWYSSVLACPWAGLVCLARLQALPFLWRCKKRPNIPPSPLFTGVSACGVHFETPHKPHKTPHFWWSASSQNWLSSAMWSYGEPVWSFKMNSTQRKPFVHRYSEQFVWNVELFRFRSLHSGARIVIWISLLSTWWVIIRCLTLSW